MRTSILKTAGVAALALVGTGALAYAGQPAPLSPDQLGALVHSQGPRVMAGVAPGPQGSGSGVFANGTTAAVKNALVSGWNTEVCYTAEWYFDGTYTYLFALNNDNSYLYAYSTGINLTALQATMLNACGSGSNYHVYLNSSGGIVALENR